MPVQIIKPNCITLLVTLRCTATCDNCCFGCNPEQGRSMTFEEMKAYVDMSLEAYPDSISKLSLTRGECMILRKDVEKIFAYAKSKGLECVMVSNAFWATDYDKAYNTLKRLRNKGLTSASFSTGYDHNKYVPWTNVRNAAVTAARLGIVSEIRVESQSWYDTTILRSLEADAEVLELVAQKKLSITSSPWMKYYNKEQKKARNYKITLWESEKKDPCNYLFQCIIINPYGEVYACCGIGVCHIPQMRLGNINKEPIKTIYERSFDDFLKIWLYCNGPQAILEFVQQKTGQKFIWHTRHHCDICRTIFTDKTIIPLLREYFHEVVYPTMMHYDIKATVENEARSKR